MDSIFKKLNYKDQPVVLIVNSPESFIPNMRSMDAFTDIKENMNEVAEVPFVLVFATKKVQVDKAVAEIAPKLEGDAVFWVAYPKGSSKKYTCDFNRDTGWDMMGKYGLDAVRQVAIDEDGNVLVWTGDVAAPAAVRARPSDVGLRAYTPVHLAEKIVTARPALAGERKQVTVLFADLKDSTELIRGLDPEAAQQLLDPAIHRMMDAVHRLEGTVNQVLGDGIMALFGAPIAHEDHALRAARSTHSGGSYARQFEGRSPEGPAFVVR
jgi:hypothetical protein